MSRKCQLYQGLPFHFLFLKLRKSGAWGLTVSTEASKLVDLLSRIRLIDTISCGFRFALSILQSSQSLVAEIIVNLEIPPITIV